MSEQIITALAQYIGAFAFLIAGLFGIYKVLWPALERKNQALIDQQQRELDRLCKQAEEATRERKEVTTQFLAALEQQIAASRESNMQLAQALERLEQRVAESNRLILQRLNVLTGVDLADLWSETEHKRVP